MKRLICALTPNSGRSVAHSGVVCHYGNLNVWALTLASPCLWSLCKLFLRGMRGIWGLEPTTPTPPAQPTSDRAAVTARAAFHSCRSFSFHPNPQHSTVARRARLGFARRKLARWKRPRWSRCCYRGATRFIVNASCGYDWLPLRTDFVGFPLMPFNSYWELVSSIDSILRGPLP